MSPGIVAPLEDIPLADEDLTKTDHVKFGKTGIDGQDGKAWHPHFLKVDEVGSNGSPHPSGEGQIPNEQIAEDRRMTQQHVNINLADFGHVGNDFSHSHGNFSMGEELLVRGLQQAGGGTHIVSPPGERITKIGAFVFPDKVQRVVRLVGYGPQPLEGLMQNPLVPWSHAKGPATGMYLIPDVVVDHSPVHAILFGGKNHDGSQLDLHSVRSNVLGETVIDLLGGGHGESGHGGIQPPPPHGNNSQGGKLDTVMTSAVLKVEGRDQLVKTGLNPALGNEQGSQQTGGGHDQLIGAPDNQQPVGGNDHHLLITGDAIKLDGHGRSVPLTQDFSRSQWLHDVEMATPKEYLGPGGSSTSNGNGSAPGPGGKYVGGCTTEQTPVGPSYSKTEVQFSLNSVKLDGHGRSVPLTQEFSRSQWLHDVEMVTPKQYLGPGGSSASNGNGSAPGPGAKYVGGCTTEQTPVGPSYSKTELQFSIDTSDLHFGGHGESGHGGAQPPKPNGGHEEVKFVPVTSLDVFQSDHKNKQEHNDKQQDALFNPDSLNGKGGGTALTVDPLSNMTQQTGKTGGATAALGNNQADRRSSGPVLFEMRGGNVLTQTKSTPNANTSPTIHIESSPGFVPLLKH
jgi:hypothetical protein